MIKKVTPTKKEIHVYFDMGNPPTIYSGIPCVCWIDDDYLIKNKMPIAGNNVMVEKFSKYKEYYDTHIDVEIMKKIQEDYRKKSEGHRAPKEE